MTIQEKIETIILSGKKLVESGLIVRTWGNISFRISENQFIITPSGRDYLKLTPEEIVTVSISDCSYSGNIKPSSEKGVHSEIYKFYPEINFIIHTHQNYASLVSTLMKDYIDVSNDFILLNKKVICADYALPGTKKLSSNISKALASYKSNAIIMKNHGAVCFSKDYKETFNVANELENACKQFINDQYLKISNKRYINSLQGMSFAISRLIKKEITITEDHKLCSCESNRIENGFVFKYGEENYIIKFDQLDNIRIQNEVILNKIKIHFKIYKKSKDINSIIHVFTPGILVLSHAGIKLLPYLDDFAQIVGTSVKTVVSDSLKISTSLKKSSAVMIKNNGALCCGPSKSEALAVSSILEKNCNAFIIGTLFGKIKEINPLESILMRFVYLKKYSKQTNIK
ncbi:MAG: class II aldolase/adducin family protein [Clostridiales bacterium]